LESAIGPVPVEMLKRRGNRGRQGLPTRFSTTGSRTVNTLHLNKQPLLVSLSANLEWLNFVSAAADSVSGGLCRR